MQIDFSDKMVALVQAAGLNIEESKQRSIYPNSMKLFNRSTIVVILQQSKDGDDFALSVGALKEACNQIQKFDIDAYIVLVDLLGNFVNQMDARKLFGRVNEFLPNPGTKEGYPPFWWITRDMHYTGNGGMWYAKNNLKRFPWEDNN